MVIALVPCAVFAETVTVSDAVTITLPSDGTQYTLVGGGKFNSLDIASDSFSFALVPGSFVDVISADKKKLTNSLSVVTTCETSQSRVRLALGSQDTAQTVSVTPSGNCSSGGGGGGGSPSLGGGGGSGGGGSSAPSVPTANTTQTTITTNTTASVSQSPTISSLREQIALLQAKIASLYGAHTGMPMSSSPDYSMPMSGAITRTLRTGSQGDDVMQLQAFLAKDTALYPEGRTTGYFGAFTRRAVERFQEKYGIAKKGDTGFGTVGPRTRAKLAELWK